MHIAAHTDIVNEVLKLINIFDIFKDKDLKNLNLQNMDKN
jgi:hypothetical protein